MLNPQQQLPKPDLFLRILRPGQPVFEVAVYDFFINHEDISPTVSVNSLRHISWEGRVLSNRELDGIKEAVGTIAIGGVPNRTKNPSSTRYTLEIISPTAFGCYEWWGELPAVWSSLSGTVKALEKLALSK